MNYLDRISKNTQMSNVMKIPAVGAELFHTDGPTDMTKLTVAFRKFLKSASKHDTSPSLMKYW